MSAQCLNCNTPLTGKYCSNCGQQADTHKINGHFLWHDIQHGLLHADKGILYTAKELFTRPGHSVREFLQGKRVKHFKPFSLVIILAGVYGFLSSYFNINLLSNNIKVSGSGEEFEQAKRAVERMSEWMSHHYSVISLAQVPILAIGTYIAFKKAGYHFMEHLVMNLFIAGQKLVLRIIIFPLFCIFNETPQLRTIARVADVAGYALGAWTLYQIFNTLKPGGRVWRIILSLLIALVIFFIILTLASKWVLG